MTRARLSLVVLTNRLGFQTKELINLLQHGGADRIVDSQVDEQYKNEILQLCLWKSFSEGVHPVLPLL